MEEEEDEEEEEEGGADAPESCQRVGAFGVVEIVVETETARKALYTRFLFHDERASRAARSEIDSCPQRTGCRRLHKRLRPPSLLPFLSTALPSCSLLPVPSLPKKSLAHTRDVPHQRLEVINTLPRPHTPDRPTRRQKRRPTRPHPPTLHPCLTRTRTRTPTLRFPNPPLLNSRHRLRRHREPHFLPPPRRVRRPR